MMRAFLCRVWGVPGGGGGAGWEGGGNRVGLGGGRPGFPCKASGYSPSPGKPYNRAIEK